MPLVLSNNTGLSMKIFFTCPTLSLVTDKWSQHEPSIEILIIAYFCGGERLIFLVTYLVIKSFYKVTTLVIKKAGILKSY